MNPLSGKPKKCKWCGIKFIPARTMQSVCIMTCAIELSLKDSEKKRKAEKKQEAQLQKQKRKEAREWIEANRSYGYLTKKAQEAVNEYVRWRDYGKPCISCGALPDYHKHLKGQSADAGHYRSTGSAPHMRFVLGNINSQCVKCNRELSGNVVEYRKSLVAKHGEEYVLKIEHDNTPRKYSKDELRRIAVIFRKRARFYKRLRGL